MRKTELSAWPQPKAKTEQVFVKQLDDETIVYDLENDHATCLNAAAAAIWNLCDGERDISQISREMDGFGGSWDVTGDNRMAAEATIQQTLEKLSASGLIVDGSVPARKMTWNATRRAFLAGVAAGVAPAVVSIPVPAAAQAASCLPNGQNCTNDAECCSGNCHTNGKCTQ